MLKRIFFIRRPLIVSIFFLLFVDVRATEEEVSKEEKQNFLKENILEKGYNAEEFVDFLEKKRGEGVAGDVNKWTMAELKQVVNEFIAKKQGENEPEILEVNKKDFSSQDQKGSHFKSGEQQPYFDNGRYNNHDQSSLKNSFYDLSHNKIARRVFDFYRYGGKVLTSLVWSVVNSYCGFEEIVMNDWYCFKYAICSGYRLQPRFMGSRVWIDMNVNFLDWIAGFLIRFFLFNPTYNMYENIFDLFNVCIDIKVYNNLYFSVNVVGIVRSFVLLFIDNDLLEKNGENSDKIIE